MHATALRRVIRLPLLLRLFLVTWVFTYSNGHAQTAAMRISRGGVHGVIKDQSNNSLLGVTVTVEKTNYATTTNVSGEYNLSIPTGNYIFVFSSVGYETARITDVAITAGQQTSLNLILVTSEGKKLTDVIVTVTARKATTTGLLLAQKNNATFTDGISAENIKATPDLNIGQSLVRVSGVTVQSGKFVTIRGVSDRYNNVLINGSFLPSTEPNRRNFSFDIIPSALVDNVVVNKTASPDLPGEFTGGLVQVNTKDVPTKNFFEVSAGSGFNTASTNKPFLSFERDSKANLGKVNSDKLWFGKDRPFQSFDYFKASVKNDTAYMRNVARSIPNRWQFYRNSYQPVQNYQLAGGIARRFVNAKSFGFTAAITYLNEQLAEEGQANNVTIFKTDAQRYRYITTLGGLLNAAFKTKKHKLAFKNLYNQRYINQVDDRIGENYNASKIQRRFSDVTFQNKLLQTRVEGEHQLTKYNVKLDWFADYISFKREQPDSRYYLQDNPPQYQFDFAQAPLPFGGLFASVFNEDRNNAGINLSLPFQLQAQKQLVKIGYSFSKRTANFENVGLRILANQQAINSIEGVGYLPYSQVVVPAYFQRGLLFYRPAYTNNSSTGDKYSGTQDLHSVYAMVDLKLLKKFRLIGGVRNEQNTMDVSTAKYEFVNLDSKITDTNSVYRETNLLPSVNLVYSPTNKINVRGAYSKTLARPDFAERSFVPYFDFAEQLQTVGTEGLRVTTVKNYDLRFEYYPTGGENLSFSIFSKDFTDPVEKNFEAGNPSNFNKYENRTNAEVKGFELDVRKSLSFVAPTSPLLKNFFITGNFTYLTGKIAIDDTTRKLDDRLLQGLSPYIINTSLSYQEQHWGANVAFNRAGRKLVVASRESPSLNQYEHPRSILDVQVNVKFLKQKLELRLTGGDLLNQRFVIYTNGDKQDGNPNNDPKGNAFNRDLDFIVYDVVRGKNFYCNVLYRF